MFGFKMADISTILDENYDDPDDGGDPTDGDGLECNTSGYQQDEELLTPCGRLQKYAHSDNIFNRQMVPSILLEIFRDASVDALTADLPALMDIIAGIANDNEIAVRTDLVQRIPHLAAACAEFSTRVPALHSVVVDHLLPLVVKYLGDPDNQVRKSTHTALLTLMEQGLVPRHAVETQICPKVLHFTHADNLMEHHTGAVVLMGKMVPLLGRETTERLFLQRFSELCSNHMFYIRKICASSFGEFCAVVSREAYENVLLPCFIELCADEIWGVRKACAEVVMTVSCASSPESRRTTLASAFARLLSDHSRWVRMSAYQTLGPFISTFADPSIIGLAYNQRGELVLINPAGTEFRINSPAFTDANLKTPTDYKQRFIQTPDNVNKSLICSQLASTGAYNEYEDYDSMPAALESYLFGEPYKNSDDSSSNSSTDLPDDSNNLQSEDVEEITKSESDISNCNNVEIVIGDVNHSVDDDKSCNKENISESELTCKGDYDNTKELNHIDTLEEKDSEIQNELVDSFTNLEVKDETKNSNNNVDNEDKEVKVEGEDELNKYNLYQYWYVSPDLPLDPAFVSSCGSPKNNCNKDSNFIRQLKNIDFDSSWYEPIPLEELIDTFPVEKSMPPIIKQNEVTQEIVPQVLIDHFVSMTEPEHVTETDNDMAYHCAFSLPAVALTLGRNNWHLLQKTCSHLASHMQYKIRRTIASSLHELALILGQDMTSEHLLPIFDGFLKDLDEVRIGVLKHLAHFLKLIGPDNRLVYLPQLQKFLESDTTWNWRFREELANQLLMTVPLLQPIDACKHLGLLGQVLLTDKVFAVRHVAISLVTELVRHMADKKKLTSRLFLQLVKIFARSKSWVDRQTFALLSSQLISKHALPPDGFATIVLPHLLNLSRDPVPNVRLAVSRTLAQDIICHEYFSDVNSERHEPVMMVLRRLQADKDRDVRQYAIPVSH